MVAYVYFLLTDIAYLIVFSGSFIIYTHYGLVRILGRGIDKKMKRK